jgi:23S rRNA (adenine2503-C2)-methyltransferase
MPQKSSQLTSLDASGQAFGCSKGSSDPLFGLSSDALSNRMVAIGEPPWRGAQLSQALYHQWINDISEMTTLPLTLRSRLIDEGWQVGRPSIAQTFRSVDGTERYLIEFAGNRSETAETVWMPEGDDGESGNDDDSETAQARRAPSSRRLSGERAGERPTRFRATICISSQIGCAVNCQFCLTAKLGLQRNLTAGEIAGQVVAILDRHKVRVGRDRVNLVFMGMGEPFLNYDNFIAAVRLLVREVGLSPQRMTVSTSGIVPGIERFVQEPLDLRPRLAISLNAPNDRIRAEVMPINRKWSIPQVIEAVRRVPLRPHERVTFEYVLLGGVTDRDSDARELARLVRRTGLPAKVNLIAWNPGPGISYATPKPEAVAAFHQILMGEGIPAFIRQPRGRDIFAACGQLKRTVDA